MSHFAVLVIGDNPEDWESQFGSLIDGLPGDTLLSVYDCHI